MESLGYEKSGRITLIGFILFSLVVVWLVNLYFEGEKDYEQGALDVRMNKEILLKSREVDHIFSSLHQNLYIQKEWMKKVLTDDSAGITNPLFSNIIYQPENDVSILDVALVKEGEFGNIIINGDREAVGYDVRHEINKLRNFFELEEVLDKALDFELNTIYYSKNNYVTYFPYVELGEKAVDYAAIFSSIDSLIDKLQTLDKEDSDFDIEQGWDRATVDDSSAKNLSFTSAMPVVTQGSIQGILTGTISEAVINEPFANNNLDGDYYLVDENQTIIATNNHSVLELSNLVDAFKSSYSNLQYYINKFPTELEVRYEKGYTLYITNLYKEGWQLVYVVDRKAIGSTKKVIVVNLLLLCSILAVIYYFFLNANKKRLNIEAIIQDSKHDSMTELLNHKNIMDALKKYISNRRVKRIAVMMLDLDDFKKVNDTFGHGVGDDVIRICAETMKEVFAGKNAVCGRYGGEEFMIVATGLDANEALILAEKVRISFNETLIEKTGLDVTLSIGLIHVMKPFEAHAEGLVNEADKNLYAAKNAGKNRVILQ